MSCLSVSILPGCDSHHRYEHRTQTLLESDMRTVSTSRTDYWGLYSKYNGAGPDHLPSGTETVRTETVRASFLSPTASG